MSVVENLRAGTMDAWGVGYLQLRERNPRSSTPPTRVRAMGAVLGGAGSYDATAQAVSGFSAVTGFPDQPPMKAGFWVGGLHRGVDVRHRILAALAACRKTGEGQMIDLSQAEAMIRTAGLDVAVRRVDGKDRARKTGTSTPPYPLPGSTAAATGSSRSPRGTKDELIPPRARLGATDPDRAWNRTPERGCVFAASRRVDEVVHRGGRRVLRGAGAWREGAVHDPHLRARGTVCSVDDPLYGRVGRVTVPRRSCRRAREESSGARKPVGGTTSGVFGEFLGVTAGEMEALARKKVIRGRGPTSPAPGPRGNAP